MSVITVYFIGILSNKIFVLLLFFKNLSYKTGNMKSLFFFFHFHSTHF